MTDKDKVINAYECVITNRSVCNCGKCDYHIADVKLLFCDSGKILRDVLALLKEQKSIIPWLSELMLNTNDEPIKPSEVIRRIEEGGLKRFAEEENK